MESRSTSQSATTTVVQSRPQILAGPSKASQYFGGHPQSYTPRKLDDESLLDSGYGSQDSSQVATPDRLGASESGSLPRDRGIELRLSKTKTLLAFNSGIDELSTTRFYSIQPTIESLLLQYTTRKSFLRSSGRHKPMAIRLLLLGNSELDAKPHIVVFCAPEMRKRVQHFFDTDELVKAFYKPEDASLPPFDVAICGCAPQLRNGEICVEVFCDATCETKAADGFDYKTTFDTTFCGTAIRLQANEIVRNATLGGVVKLEYATGESKLYGLTAGHAARACLDNGNEQDMHDGESDIDDGSIDTSIAHSDSDWSHSDLEESLDEDSDSEPSFNKATGNGSDADPWAFEHPQALGDVLSHGDPAQVEKQPSKGSFDWALVDIKDCKPNRLPAFMFQDNLDRWKAGITDYQKQSPAAKGLSEDRVILMCGSSGPKFGYLAAQPARILIDSSSLFVDAYMVILEGGDALVDGDSGSWVVTEETHQVIGHIVATDPLGAGYIIPLCDIFSDIQQSLGVHTVSLPSVRDIEVANFKALRFNTTQNKIQEQAESTDYGGREEIVEDFRNSEEAAHLRHDPVLAMSRPPVVNPVPVFVAAGHLSARPPTPDEDDFLPTITMERELKIEPRPRNNLPTPRASVTSSSDTQSDRARRRSGIYINGQEVADTSEGKRAHRNRSSRSRSQGRRERIVIVDGPPVPRQPPNSFASYSKADSVSHDSGYSSYGGSSRNSPSYGMVNPTDNSREVSFNKPVMSHRRQRVRTEVADPKEEELRARIMAANAAIAARPAAPPLPHSLIRGSRTSKISDKGEKEAGTEADVESELAEAVRQLSLSPRARSRRAGKGEAATRAVRETEEEEEARQQRLRERIVPRRRASVAPGIRPHTVLYDDGASRWE